jgi:ABC-2 type transport system permease protein
MNSNLLPLLRVQYRIAWRTFRDNLGGGRSRWGLLLIPVMAISFVPILGVLVSMYVVLFGVTRALGESHLLLTVALTAGQLVCLMFGIFYVISAFYFSKDLPVLVPLPIRPGEIVLAKFIGILGGEYLTIAPVVLPALAVYGVMAKVSWTYIPFALVIYLLLPVVPLVLSSLFSMALMRLTNMRRNRDVWRVVGALFGVALAVSINYITRFGHQNGKFSPGVAAQQMQQLLEQQRALIDVASRYFPTSTWAAHALREGAPAFGAGSFLLYVAVAVALLGLLLWAAEKIFYGGLLGGEDVRSKGKALTREELTRETGQQRSPLWALLQREIKLLNRTPSFLMAAVLPVVLVPVMMFFGVAKSGDMGRLLEQMPRAARSGLVPVVSMGVVLFLSMISNIGATAISREGRHFWISRSLPVAPRVQVQAKMLHSLIFTLFNLAIVLVGLSYMRLMTPFTLGAVVAGGLLAGVAASAAGLVIDLQRPHLTWTDPQQAMKGNTNVLFAMLATMLMGALLALVSGLLYAFARPALLPGVIVLLAIEAATLVRVAGWLADKRYTQYED